MEILQRRRIQKLALDSEKALRELERLKANAARVAEWQGSDLTGLEEHVKRMEVEVIWMLSQCSELIHRSREVGNQPISSCLSRALAALKVLVGDLKRAREALNAMPVRAAQPSDVIIDFPLLDELLHQVRKRLEAGERLLSLMETKKVIPFACRRARR